MRKYLALILAGAGTLVASTCFGAGSSIFIWTASNTQDLTTQILTTAQDFIVPVLLVLGIAIGFIILRKVIGLVKGGAR
jgi:hypothetical protein